MEIPEGCSRKTNLMWNFHGSQFLTLEFARGVTQLAEFPGVKAFLLQNFLGLSDKSKISRGGRAFQKSISSIPSLDFSGIIAQSGN